MVSPSRSTCGAYEVSNAPPTRLMPGLPVRKEIGENGKRNVSRVHDSEVVGSCRVVLKPSRGFRIGVVFVLVHIDRRELCELSAQCLRIGAPCLHQFVVLCLRVDALPYVYGDCDNESDSGQRDANDSSKRRRECGDHAECCREERADNQQWPRSRCSTLNPRRATHHGWHGVTVLASPSCRARAYFNGPRRAHPCPRSTALSTRDRLRPVLVLPRGVVVSWRSWRVPFRRLGTGSPVERLQPRLRGPRDRLSQGTVRRAAHEDPPGASRRPRQRLGAS